MTQDLRLLASQIRYLTLRELHHLGYGHFGGSLSIVEALAALYGGGLRIDPDRPDWPQRDYFVLSKGHAGPALYAALAIAGFFEVDRLWRLNANGTDLPSHPDRRLIPGVEMTTGSMGQGLSVAAGIAYGLRTAEKPSRVVALLGDGELNEGQCWEAVQFIAARRLHNLVVMVDSNQRQLDGPTADIGGAVDFSATFEAFGFATELVPGQDAEAIAAALARAQRCPVPVCLVLNTTKGAGVAQIEAAESNHHMRLDAALRSAVESAIDSLGRQLQEAGIHYD